MTMLKKKYKTDASIDFPEKCQQKSKPETNISKSKNKITALSQMVAINNREIKDINNAPPKSNNSNNSNNSNELPHQTTRHKLKTIKPIILDLSLPSDMAAGVAVQPAKLIS